MKQLKYIILSLVALPFLFACDNDEDIYASPYVESNTTDYLRANRYNMFEMALDLYEKAGLIDLLDKKGVTVFMPSDYSIRHYMAQRGNVIQKETGDPNYEYTYADLLQDLPSFQDSLKMYIVEKEVNRSDLEALSDEAVMVTSMLGTEMQISLKKTKLYTENVPNAVNKYLYYTHVINGLDDPNVASSSIPVEDRDVTNYCQTSGLITQTGILHVLRDEHPLFFNKMEYK